MSLLRRLVASSWNTATSTLASRIRIPLHPQAAPWWNAPQNILARAFGSGSTRKHKHKRLLKHSKGFRGRAKNCYSIAVRRVQKGWQHAYKDRKRKRRDYKKIWIQRINAGVRQYAFRYSEFMHLAYGPKCNIGLNRKVLADLAANEPFAFKAIVDVVQEATGVYKEPAVYSHEEEAWDFEPEEEDSHYYDEQIGDWVPTKDKKKLEAQAGQE